jgi:energy-coupling factor transporter ATP-binding protein EcfA2
MHPAANYSCQVHAAFVFFTHTLARGRKKSLAISVVLLLDEHIQVVEEMMVNGDGGGW